MRSRNATRRDFMAQAALSAVVLHSVGKGSSSPNSQPNREEFAARYDEFIGQSVMEVPTPALLIDLDVFESNMAAMRDACAARSRNYRPHGKAHKSPVIAKKQLEYGAQGQCAAKLGEAEVLVNGGIRDVLITAPVVGPRKIQRLLALQAITPDVKVVVDSLENIKDLSAASAAKNRKLKVLIDVNVGQNRTGIDTPQEAADLARQIDREKGLELAVQARRGVEKAGFPVGILSVGGTGTYNIDTEIPEVTEIQPGSFIFMD